MTDSFEEMRRKMAGLDSTAMKIARASLDPLAEAMKLANPTIAVMDEVARQQRLIELSTTHIHSAKALHNIGVMDEMARQQRLIDLASPNIHSAKALHDISATVASFTRNDAAISSAFKAIYDPVSRTGIDASLAQISHQAAIHAAVMGPIAQLRDSGALATIASVEAVNATRVLTDYESKFRIAARADIDAIALMTRADYQLATIYKDDILLASRALDHAFVRVDSPIVSVQAFAELQGISRAVASLAPFDDQLTRSLRTDLGDWRGLSAIPVANYADIAVRTSFYVDQGLRPELTDFPADAFDSVISFPSIEAFSLADEFGEPIDVPDDEDPTEFAQTNEVQGWLNRYERRIRVFIDTRMTKAYGTDWPRLKLPPETYKDWLGKSQKAAAVGKPDKPLIIFADFTHYMPIICGKGHWPLFQDAFRTKDPVHVRESFFRLEVPRLEVFHGRMLTQQDYLLIYAELSRLNTAIKSN